MKTQVRVDQLWAELWRRSESDHLIHSLLHLIKDSWTRIPEQQFGGIQLMREAHSVEFTLIARAERDDRKSAAGGSNDQALCLENLDRLTNRDSANPHRQSQLAFDQPGPRLKVPFEDRLAETT